MPRRLVILLAALAAVLSFTAGALAGQHTTTTIVLHNQTWHCTSPQNDTHVIDTIDSPDVKIDAIHLDAGCTGVIKLTVSTNSGDGVKIHDGATDLTVHGSVTCSGKTGVVHQDGVQAMGGDNVLLERFKVDCPTGNNGGLFVNGGRGGNSVPTNIVCDHCSLFERNAALHVGPNSIGSGARDSTLYQGTGDSSPADCARIDKAAQSPVDTGNVCLPSPPA